MNNATMLSKRHSAIQESLDLRCFLSLLVFFWFPLPLLADADVHIEQNRGTLCGYFADGSWDDFNAYIQRNELPLEKVVMVSCNIGRTNLRPANAYQRIIASNPGVIDLIQHINRYLLRNGHEAVFNKLVAGDLAQVDVFEELLNSYGNSGAVRQSGIVAAAQMFCTRIMGRRGPKIAELMYLYDQHCTSGPLRLDSFR